MRKKVVASLKFDAILYEEIGRKVKDARVMRGFTQQELSDRIRLSRSSVASIEIGVQKIPLHTLYEICFVLGIEVHQVLPNNNKDTYIS
ncbi:helix-turn-helix domain-containing protein [Paenibacillus sp. V4I5]|uniref:helix-turn-helix domain-containing protein n=1 Tax=Paenibacillus sp. V4I5 TaxID=3042306 RepID=UPI00278E22D7|nr:helix-turn-helix transcriptional regulator [Paenibacillus sp. V4I5]MDQ0914658.1 transcriptional regulator with XRE-family HTH domain [Paenibacillus sp. V4I5]